MTAAPVREPSPYGSPYLAGVGLGLVLLAAIVVVGHGIGASGAFAEVVAAGSNAVAPEHTAGNAYLRGYVAEGRNPLASWIVLEVAGMFAGALLSAWLAGRIRRDVERGPAASVRLRIVAGFGGGALMGFAARIARGCTSGQALTGGALLSVGSWVFMLALFAAAYAVAPLVRRQWT